MGEDTPDSPVSHGIQPQFGVFIQKFWPRRVLKHCGSQKTAIVISPCTPMPMMAVRRQSITTLRSSLSPQIPVPVDPVPLKSSLEVVSLWWKDTKSTEGLGAAQRCRGYCLLRGGKQLGAVGDACIPHSQSLPRMEPTSIPEPITRPDPPPRPLHDCPFLSSPSALMATYHLIRSIC